MGVNGLELIGIAFLVLIVTFLVFYASYALYDYDEEMGLLTCCIVSITVITILAYMCIDYKRQIDNYKEQLAVYEEEP